MLRTRSAADVLSSLSRTKFSELVTVFEYLCQIPQKKEVWGYSKFHKAADGSNQTQLTKP